MPEEGIYLFVRNRANDPVAQSCDIRPRSRNLSKLRRAGALCCGTVNRWTPCSNRSCVWLQYKVDASTTGKCRGWHQKETEGATSISGNCWCPTSTQYVVRLVRLSFSGRLLLGRISSIILWYVVSVMGGRVH